MTARGTIFQTAFGLIGISNYAYDVSVEEQETASLKLDAMMRQPAWRDIGYTAASVDPDPDVEMTTDPQWDDAIAYNLAVRIAPDFGKTPSAFVRGEAKRLYGDVVAATLKIPAMRETRVPIAGAGNWWRRWVLP